MHGVIYIYIYPTVSRKIARDVLSICVTLNTEARSSMDRNCGESAIRKTERAAARHFMNFSSPFGRTAN